MAPSLRWSWVVAVFVAVACSSEESETAAPDCADADEPACPSSAPASCVSGQWTCSGCDPAGAGAADCWDACHGFHLPFCEEDAWQCLDPAVGGCGNVGGGGGAGGMVGSGG